MPAAIDLCDPSPEGEQLAYRLRSAGHPVRELDVGSLLQADADVVLLAGDMPDALAALRRLRDEGIRGDVPVILLGAPRGRVADGGPAFGAVRVLPRPVSVPEVRQAIGEVLAEEEPIASPASPSLDTSQVLSVDGARRRPSWRPEPTIQLEGELPETEPPSEPPAEAQPASADLSSGSLEPELAPDARALLSPRLLALLEAADRRVFPDRSAHRVQLPDTDEGPDQLVPPELLEGGSRSASPRTLDPFDAFTFVGVSDGSDPPADAPPTEDDLVLGVPDATEQGEDAGPDTDDGGHTTGVLRTGPYRGRGLPEDDPVLGPSDADGARRGALGPGGALRLLLHLARIRVDAALALEGAVTLRLVFEDGHPIAAEGPLAAGTLASLRGRGVALPPADGEREAEAVLGEALASGGVSPFEHDRSRREALLDALGAVVLSPSLTFRLSPQRPEGALGPLLGAPLSLVLLAVARQALTADVVEALLGDRPVGFRLVEDGARWRDMGVASDLIALLRRLSGRPLRAIQAAAPSEPGLPGLLYALLAADAVELVDVEDEPFPSVEAARGRVQAAVGRARDGDYFSILGVEREAGEAEVERAWARRAEALRAIPLGALGLGELEPERAEALAALDEARAVLRVERWRGVYAGAPRG